MNRAHKTNRLSSLVLIIETNKAMNAIKEGQRLERMIRETKTEKLTTQFPLSEKDEVAAASLRTKELYEKQQKVNRKDQYHEQQKQKP